MKPLSEWKQVDFEGLIGLTEGQTVEFKQSEALLFTGKEADERRRELVKDVTALANAAGGRIYFGLREAKGVAASIDDGIPAADLKPERINDILTSNIEPAIHGAAVYPIPLDNGNRGFVIDVPQATTLAPHQSRLHKQYFRRYDTKAQAMLDHEIKDLMRRSEAPLIVVEAVREGQTADNGAIFAIRAENASPALVKYFAVSFIFPGGLEFQQPEFSKWDFGAEDVVEKDGTKWTGQAYSKNFTPTSHMPLFFGQKHTLLRFNVGNDRNPYKRFHIKIAAHGFIGRWSGFIQSLYSRHILTLEELSDVDLG